MNKLRKIRTLDPTKMKYVMYCRKSTDEKGKQEQSIFSQLDSCKRYIDSNGYSLAPTPVNDQVFFCQKELQKEIDEFGEGSGRLTELLPYFVVIERETAHKPNKRPKRKQLMKMAKNGQIDGIISYSPDRHARNMLEAGELVDALDNGFLDVKYVTFQFQNTTDGKMMLTMLFSFAKHYSDQRSDLTYRGFESSVNQGRALGQSKRGYYVNEEDKFVPHEKYFPMMQKAFQMKIHEKAKDKDIKEYLKKEGFKMCKRVGIKRDDYKKKLYEEVETEFTMLGEVRKDSFYYGLYIYGENQADQTQLNPEYKPAVTKDERDMLQDIITPEYRLNADRKKKEENEEFYPFPQGMVINEHGDVLNPGLPNKKRFIAKLERLQHTKPDAVLADVVEPHQINYRVAKKKASEKNGPRTAITADILIKKVQVLLESFSITEEFYQLYVRGAQEKIKEGFRHTTEKSSNIASRLKALEKRRSEYISSCIPSLSKMGEMEHRVYEEEITKYDNKISQLKREREDNEKIQRNEPLEIVGFLELLRDLRSAYAKSDYVRKAKVASILFSNIIIGKKKQVTIRVIDAFKPLFKKMVGDIGLEPTTSTMSM